MVSASEIAARFPAVARHAERMVRPLDEMCRMFVASIEHAVHKDMAERLFASLNLDDRVDDYARIQEKHLSECCLAAREVIQAELGENMSPEFKYLDLPFWVWGKYAAGRKIGLDKMPSTASVLDIGCGPGHFSLVCSSFGMTCLGIDRNLKPLEGTTDRHLYHDLSDILGYENQTLLIVSDTDLGTLGKFDLITCLMGTFCVNLDEQYMPTPWRVDQWIEFMETTKGRALAPDGCIYFNIARQYITDDIYDYLSGIAESADRERSVYTFRNR